MQTKKTARDRIDAFFQAHRQLEAGGDLVTIGLADLERLSDDIRAAITDAERRSTSQSWLMNTLFLVLGYALGAVPLTEVLTLIKKQVGW